MTRDEKVDLVESIIDQMVESEEPVDVTSAVSAILDGEVPEVVEFDLEEGEGTPDCVVCGSSTMTPGVVESEDGMEIPAFHCEACDTGYVADIDGVYDEDEGEDEVYEAEIDDENPICPVCEEDSLDAELVEDEGEEIPVITCQSCGSQMIPVGD